MGAKVWLSLESHSNMWCTRSSKRCRSFGNDMACYATDSKVEQELSRVCWRLSLVFGPNVIIPCQIVWAGFGKTEIEGKWVQNCGYAVVLRWEIKNRNKMHNFLASAPVWTRFCDLRTVIRRMWKKIGFRIATVFVTLRHSNRLRWRNRLVKGDETAECGWTCFLIEHFRC